MLLFSCFYLLVFFFFSDLPLFFLLQSDSREALEWALPPFPQLPMRVWAGHLAFLSSVFISANCALYGPLLTLTLLKCPLNSFSWGASEQGDWP